MTWLRPLAHPAVDSSIGPRSPALSRSRSVAHTLDDVGRWLLLCAIPSAMVTPSMSFGLVHLGLSDVLAVGGATCWVFAWASARSRPVSLGVAKWPLLALMAGVLSMTASVDYGASAKGLIELFGLWVLPSLAVAGLFTSDQWRTRLLSAASTGSLVAAAINSVSVLRVGLTGGLPQILGAAGGFQGYFQVLGIAVAFPRLATALSDRRVTRVAGWSAAVILHGVALLLTQTRGAWVAGLVATAVLGVVGKRAFFVAVGFALIAGLVVAVSADPATVIRERIHGVFQPEVSVSGFDSSVIRMALAATALTMFLAHPLTGVGLKGFVQALPYYAPAGLPLAVETGPDQVLTLIASPHSTYLSLLSETGILGGVAIVGWVAGAWWGTYKWTQEQPPVEVLRRQVGATLIGAIAGIGIFNLFGEMNASGAVPLTVLLALGYGLRGAEDQRPIGV